MAAIDRKLIALLRQDGRRSVSDLAMDLGVTRATVRNRLTKLSDTGFILGYSVILKADTIEHPVRAIMLIEIEGKASDKVVKQLHGLADVQTIHTTNGRWDLIVEIGTETLDQFDDVLRQVRLFEGIAASETNLLLSTRKHRQIGAITQNRDC